jgi:glycosyltransferase involved in cell wall biosynthesis
MRPSILFLSNIPTPYQIDFWTAVGQHASVNIVFCTNTERNRHWTFNENITALKITTLSESNSIPQKFRNCFALARLILTNRPSHIIVGGYSHLEFIFCFFFCVFLRIPRYFWLERPLSNKASFYKKYILSCLLTKSHVIAIGRLAADFYKKYSKKITNIPYSINHLVYKTGATNSSKDMVTFLFVGQFIARKNILGLIDQFKIACETKKIRDRCFLRMIGDGEQLPLMIEQLQHSGLTNWEIKPFLQKQALIDELHKGDVLVIPSHHDGWAVVVNEAISAGLAVIATSTVGAAHDVVTPYRCGFVIKSISELNSKIKTYVTSPSRLNRHKKAAASCSYIFSAESQARRLINIL